MAELGGKALGSNLSDHEIGTAWKPAGWRPCHVKLS